VSTCDFIFYFPLNWPVSSEVPQSYTDWQVMLEKMCCHCGKAWVTDMCISVFIEHSSNSNCCLFKEIKDKNEISVIIYLPSHHYKPVWLPLFEKQLKYSLKYLLLCSTEEEKSYRFGMTWGWVNNERILIFGWTVSLTYPSFVWTYSWKVCMAKVCIICSCKVNGLFDSYCLLQQSFS